MNDDGVISLIVVNVEVVAGCCLDSLASVVKFIMLSTAEVAVVM